MKFKKLKNIFYNQIFNIKKNIVTIIVIINNMDKYRTL